MNLENSITEIERRAWKSGRMALESVTYATPHRFGARQIELQHTTSRLDGHVRSSWAVRLSKSPCWISRFNSPEAALAFYGVAVAA